MSTPVSHAAPAVASRSIAIPFAAIVLAMLPAVLDQTILATALPTIAGELGRLTDVSWVVTAYVVAAAATTPLWGKLGDRYGRKRLLEISLATFLVGSALCGIAQSITMLVVSRALQGIAAGGLMTLAMASVGDLVEPRERGRYQGYITSTFAVATVAGPLIGGLLVEHVSWRWVFYVNLPLGVAALVGLRTRLPEGETERPAHGLDVLGAVLLAGATCALLLACIWGGERYAWDSATIVGLFAATAALAVGLVVRERRAADPIVPLDLLRTRVVAVASAAFFFVTATLFAITVFVPLFLQVTTGATPTQAGLLLVPMMIGITLSTNLAGRAVSRTGRLKRFPVAGLSLMTGALVLLAIVVGAPVAGDDVDRPGRLRPRLRHDGPDADRRGAERRRPPPARRRDGHDHVPARPRRCDRRRRPRRDLRRARRHGPGGPRRRHRRRPDRLPRRGAAGGDRPADRPGAARDHRRVTGGPHVAPRHAHVPRPARR